MLEYKGLKPLKDDVLPRGIYTKIGRTIFEEFQKDVKKHAEIDLKYDKKGQLLSLYQAMKSLIRRKQAEGVQIRIDRTKGKIYIYKLADL